MKLGDHIKLHFEREPIFGEDNPKIVDGEFTVINVSYEMPHCFGDDLWSGGFNHFDFGEYQDGQPDIVRLGSIYVPTPSFLDEAVVKDLHYDKKVVSWEIISAIQEMEGK